MFRFILRIPFIIFFFLLLCLIFPFVCLCKILLYIWCSIQATYYYAFYNNPWLYEFARCCDEYCLEYPYNWNEK